MSRSLRIGLLLLLLLPFTAQGQDAPIKVDDGDSPLVIRGWVGEENSFIGNIGLTLQGAAQVSNPVKLNIYRSDLNQVGGAEMIGRQLVAVRGDQTLTPDMPSVYQVKVSGLKVPGEYHGKIEFLLAGQRREAAMSVKMAC